jgi:hypothetical protein
LGDLGNVVLDEPGLVGMAKVVEVHAGDDRRGVVLGVAVEGGAEDAAGEAGAAVETTAGAAEDLRVVVAAGADL